MNKRYHYLDACRGILMILAIPYHAALVFTTEIPWVVQAREVSSVFDVFAPFLGTFRMSAFFLIAGFFAFILVQRQGPWTWFNGRLERLAIPLLTATLLFTPLQHAAVQVSIAADQGTLINSSDILQAAVATMVDPGGDKLFHLWFLIDLLVLCVVLAATWNASAQSPHLAIVVTRLEGALLTSTIKTVALAFLLLGIYNVLIHGSGKFLGANRLEFLNVLDLHSILKHAPYFVIGLIVAQRPTILGLMTTPSLVGSVAGFAFAGVIVLIGPYPGTVGMLVKGLLGPACALLLTHVLMSVCRIWLDRPSRLGRFAADSAFTVYLVHHPLIVFFAVVFSYFEANPIIGFLLIVCATTMLSALFHIMISRNPPLLYLFNGVGRRATPCSLDKATDLKRPGIAGNSIS